MSDPDPRPPVSVLGGRESVTAESVRELTTGRLVPLGRRMVGAWCFIDHYGPDDIAEQPGMQVPPHPHMGLQTVSWLHAGEVLHRDSLGSVQTVRPRQLSLMTTGRAITHSEESPRGHAPILHGAQLWVALPDAHRDTDPRFEFHPDLPVVTGGGLRATVIMGELDTAASPGTAYSPLVGADLELAAGTDVRLPLMPDFEYAVLAMSGAADVDGVEVTPGSLLYLGAGRTDLALRADSGGGLMLLGGEPFDEQIVMWWNLIGRTGPEIAEARAAWAAGERFGAVHGYDGARLAAPELPPTPLKARGRVR